MKLKFVWFWQAVFYLWGPMWVPTQSDEIVNQIKL